MPPRLWGFFPGCFSVAFSGGGFSGYGLIYIPSCFFALEGLGLLSCPVVFPMSRYFGFFSVLTGFWLCFLGRLGFWIGAISAMIPLMWVGGLLRGLEPFLIALFFTIWELPLETCGGFFPLWLSLGIFGIWAGFWVQYFGIAPLLSGLAPFLDLGVFSRCFSEGVFRVCGGFLGMGIWGGVTG